MAVQSPAERLFTLTCCLMAAPRIGLSKQDIFAAVPGYSEIDSPDALERMFDRDKGSLRELGVQLEILGFDQLEDTDGHRYRIAQGGFAWPSDLELTPAQLGLIELAGRAWNNQQFAQSARTGLARLKSRGMVQVERQLGFISPRILAKHKSFEPLAAAVADQQMVLFEYRKPDAAASLREVEPLKLRLLQGEWVLLAREGKEIKNFLLRRIISQVKLSGARFEPATEAEITAAEQDLVEFTGTNRAKLELIEDSEAYWHFGGTGTEVEISYMDEALLAEDLLEFGPDIRVLSPDSLSRRLTEALKRVVTLHA